MGLKSGGRFDGFSVSERESEERPRKGGYTKCRAPLLSFFYFF